eukprot:Selendium_serpulae@DN4181_c1_g1_i3.p1
MFLNLDADVGLDIAAISSLPPLSSMSFSPRFKYRIMGLVNTADWLIMINHKSTKRFQRISKNQKVPEQNTKNAKLRYCSSIHFSALRLPLGQLGQLGRSLKLTKIFFHPRIIVVDNH